MKKYIVFIIVLIICISCAGHFVNVTPEYQNKFIDAEKLFIQIVPDTPKIEVNDNLITSLGKGSNSEIYLSYFEKKFPESVVRNSAFQQAEISLKEYQFDEAEFIINDKEKVILNIPASNNQIVGNDGEYTLFLENLEIYQKEGEDDLMIPSAVGQIFIVGDDPQIVQLGKFVIWDNNLNKVVAFGKINVTTDIKENDIEETWTDANNALSEYLFAESPFRKQR